jgi:ubiquinone/menaquinone biosynthesis C-methylase UbiE
MTLGAVDKVFAGSIPQVYQSHMVPLIFEPYAKDLAKRLVQHGPSRVLEIAAGTGVVTRALDAALDPKTSIVATDLNPAMLEEARTHATRRSIDWRPADAMALPFGDAAFDCVVCQFGAMFFPEKPRAFGEARRVLSPGGVFLFNVWDRIEENEIAEVVTQALAGLFPADPPRFMARTPHGYNDTALVARHLEEAGFVAPRIETVSARSIAPTALDAAIAYCQGTPLRSEIEGRGGSLEEATRVCARALEERFGHSRVDAKIQAHVVTAER